MGLQLAADSLASPRPNVDSVIFTSRLLPVIRTLISLPGGIAKMNFPRFLIYTFSGSFLWCFGLTYGGYELGEHWEQISEVMRPFWIPIVVVIAALIGLYIYRHVKAAPSKE